VDGTHNKKKVKREKIREREREKKSALTERHEGKEKQ
jgi:hypothetical protein